jgi:hypothetical protein
MSKFGVMDGPALENKVQFLSVGKYAAPPFHAFRPPPLGVAPHSLLTTALHLTGIELQSCIL